jgi:GT2 family glycosyltransferase
MSQLARVAVIIVNYNGGALLTECVLSVLNSSLPVTVYLVDNASSDDSLATLQAALAATQPVHIVRNACNRGFAGAANQVLSQLSHDYIVFLNPDCVIQTDTLARFCATLDQPAYQRYGMAGCLVRNPDGSEQAGCRRSIPSPWRSVVRVLHLNRLFPHQQRFASFVLTHSPMPTEPVELEGISGACMVVRQAALQAVGPMDEQYFVHCEDLDWFMRFRAAGWPILFIPHIEIMHVKGACSQRTPLRVLWYKHRGMIRFYTKFFRQQYPRPLYWSVVAAVWLRFGILAIPTALHVVLTRLFWATN